MDVAPDLHQPRLEPLGRIADRGLGVICDCLGSILWGIVVLHVLRTGRMRKRVRPGKARTRLDVGATVTRQAPLPASAMIAERGDITRGWSTSASVGNRPVAFFE